jgi:hypothetical protein
MDVAVWERHRRCARACVCIATVRKCASGHREVELAARTHTLAGTDELSPLAEPTVCGGDGDLEANESTPRTPRLRMLTMAQAERKGASTRRVILFDLDDVLAESHMDWISVEVLQALERVSAQYSDIEMGVCSAATYDRVCKKLGPRGERVMRHIFSEDGCVYHARDAADARPARMIYCRDLRTHPGWPRVQAMMRVALGSIARFSTHYALSGQLLDVRNGSVCVSLVGQQATPDELAAFVKVDSTTNRFKRQLLTSMQAIVGQSGLTLVERGDAEIVVRPLKWGPAQVIESFDLQTTSVSYYGNEPTILLQHDLDGHPVDRPASLLTLLQRSYPPRQCQCQQQRLNVSFHVGIGYHE